MILYDEDAFWGSGEYEVLAVSEVIEYLTDEERELFDSLCLKAEKRRHKAELKEECFHRGYDYARRVTNEYQGRAYRRTFDEYDVDDIYTLFEEQF